MAIRLALRKSAVVATLTRTTGLRMIHFRDGFETARAVAGAAGACAGNMGARFCARNHVVMTINTSANHFVVIDLLRRRPRRYQMTRFAMSCRLNMRIRLAPGRCAVMAR